jgi:phenylpropionate dioxygenase-like ring-hydroxylating dioxygenase large terminal subunit
MWMPVVESKTLRDAPVATHYWGTPVVLFRTQSGAIAALEDLCGHRGTALSKGRVVKDAIRCSYHHFAFDRSGACTSIPSVFGVSESERAACTVRRFHVRERLGLVWISIESEATAPFPLEEDPAPAGTEFSTGLFDLTGDIRVWMEHYLDFAHAIFPHAHSLYRGNERVGYAEPESFTSHIHAKSRYPVRSAADFVLRTPRMPLARALIQSGGLVRYITRALGGASRAPGYIKFAAQLLTPVTQIVDLEFTSGFGTYQYLNFTSLIPIREDKLQMIFSAFLHPRSGARRGPVLRKFIDWYLRHTIEVSHIKGEDAAALGTTRYRPTFFSTKWDAPITPMRHLFTAYVKERGHLYPADSLIHRLEMTPEESPSTAAPTPSAVPRPAASFMREIGSRSR